MKKRIVIYLVLLTNILLSQKIITPKDVKLFLLSIVENADTDIIQKYGKDADDLLRTGYTIKSNSINDDRVIEQNYRTYVIIYGEELRKDPFLKPKVDEVAVIQKQSPQKNIYLKLVGTNLEISRIEEEFHDEEMVSYANELITIRENKYKKPIKNSKRYIEEIISIFNQKDEKKLWDIIYKRNHDWNEREYRISSNIMEEITEPNFILKEQITDDDIKKWTESKNYKEWIVLFNKIDAELFDYKSYQEFEYKYNNDISNVQIFVEQQNNKVRINVKRVHLSMDFTEELIFEVEKEKIRLVDYVKAG